MQCSYSYIAICHNIVSVRAGSNLSMSKLPDTCDWLDASHLFSGRYPIITFGHVAAIHTLILQIALKLRIYYHENLLSLKIRPCYKIYIL